MTTNQNSLVWVDTGEQVTIADLCGNVRPGWHALVKETVRDLFMLGWDGRVGDVKQKLSALVIYVENGSPEINGYLWQARERSHWICECCSGKHELRTFTGGEDPEPCCSRCEAKCWQVGWDVPDEERTLWPERLNEIVRLHGLYLAGDKLGRRAEVLGATAPGADLANARLARANFHSSNMKAANLENTDLVDSNWDHCQLEGANLRASRLTGASLTGTSLNGADMEGADLRTARLHGTSFIEANLQNVNLAYQYLAMCKFRGAKMAGSNLEGAYIATLHRDATRKATFAGADLAFASMVDVEAHRTSFQRANLLHADCERADFMEADFRGACLKEANLKGADMKLALIDAETQVLSEWSSQQVADLLSRGGVLVS